MSESKSSKVLDDERLILIDFLRQNKSEEAKHVLKKNPRLMTTTDDVSFTFLSVKSGRSVIHWAASGGCVDMLKYCIAMDENSISYVDDMEWTPLMIASSAGRVLVVEILLDSNAEVDKHNKNGQTALHYAASKNHPEITKMLLRKGANINARDKYKATPLHRAASQGHERVVHLLLSDPRIVLDCTDSTGCTPLHLAIEEDRTSVAIALAARGASLDYLNKEEKTPLDLASSGELIRKLKKAAENFASQ